jgi:hypothetical protein
MFAFEIESHEARDDRPKRTIAVLITHRRNAVGPTPCTKNTGIKP